MSNISPLFLPLFVRHFFLSLHFHCTSVNHPNYHLLLWLGQYPQRMHWPNPNSLHSYFVLIENLIHDLSNHIHSNFSCTLAFFIFWCICSSSAYHRVLGFLLAFVILQAFNTISIRAIKSFSNASAYWQHKSFKAFLTSPFSSKSCAAWT